LTAAAEGIKSVDVKGSAVAERNGHVVSKGDNAMAEKKKGCGCGCKGGAKKDEGKKDQKPQPAKK
jgi:hypothetical protein